MSYPYTISTTDSLVQIDTRTATGNILINLSSFTNGNITIRDIGGSASFFNTSFIQISTLNGYTFNDMTTSHYINKPYGYITVRPSMNQWNIQTEYDNAKFGTANELTTDSIYISTLYASTIYSIYTSTVNMNVSSLAIQNGSTIATTVFWSTSIAALPTSGPGRGYVATTLLNNNTHSMASDYKYISSTWLNLLNIDLARAFQLVSTNTYLSTFASIGPAFGYMSTIVTGTNNGFVQYGGGYNAGSISSTGKCVYLTVTPTVGGITPTLTNALQAGNISMISNLKYNQIVSNNFTGNYTTATLLYSGSLSDRRLKTDIRPITNALQKIRSLRAVSYKMNDDRMHLGLIAQEVEGVVPEVVTGSPEGIMGIQYGDLVGLLIEGVKELKGRMDALEALNTKRHKLYN